MAGTFLGVATLSVVSEEPRFLKQWMPLFYGAIPVTVMTSFRMVL